MNDNKIYYDDLLKKKPDFFFNFIASSCTQKLMDYCQMNGYSVYLAYEALEECLRRCKAVDFQWATGGMLKTMEK